MVALAKKISPVLAVAYGAFVLGGYTYALGGDCSQARGGPWAWVAILSALVVMGTGAYLVLRGPAASGT